MMLVLMVDFLKMVWQQAKKMLPKDPQRCFNDDLPWQKVKKGHLQNTSKKLLQTPPEIEPPHRKYITLKPPWECDVWMKYPYLHLTIGVQRVSWGSPKKIV